MAASFVVELTVTLADVACTSRHPVGIILRLVSSLAHLKVAIVAHAAWLIVICLVSATLPLVTQGSRTSRLLV